MQRKCWKMLQIFCITFSGSQTSSIPLGCIHAQLVLPSLLVVVVRTNTLVFLSSWSGWCFSKNLLREKKLTPQTDQHISYIIHTWELTIVQLSYIYLLPWSSAFWGIQSRDWMILIHYRSSPTMYMEIEACTFFLDRLNIYLPRS